MKNGADNTPQIEEILKSLNHSHRRFLTGIFLALPSSSILHIRSNEVVFQKKKKLTIENTKSNLHIRSLELINYELTTSMFFTFEVH